MLSSIFRKPGKEEEKENPQTPATKLKVQSSLPGVSSFAKRVQTFKRVLAEPTIDLHELQNLSFDGIPENQGLKALIWKILLEYLPLESTNHEKVLERQRDLYAQYLADLFTFGNDLAKQGGPRGQKTAPTKKKAEMPTKKIDGPSTTHEEKIDKAHMDPRPPVVDGERKRGRSKALEQRFSLMEVSIGDDPLSLGNSTTPGKSWEGYFEEREQRLEIEKDIDRTHQGLMFFHRDLADDSKSRTYKWGKKFTKHSEVLTRILMCFAKLNPGIKYVQGMNELLSPIYYVFSTDKESPQFAEADAFFCFTNLMGYLNDRFCADADQSQLGIVACINEFDGILKEEDPVLWNFLVKIKVDPKYYALRYLSLLLTMEFQLPEVLRLWDSFLGDPLRFKFCTYVVTAMLINARKKLLEGDFTTNLMLLQRYPGELQDVLKIANRIQERRHPDVWKPRLRKPNPRRGPSSSGTRRSSPPRKPAPVSLRPSNSEPTSRRTKSSLGAEISGWFKRKTGRKKKEGGAGPAR